MFRSICDKDTFNYTLVWSTEIFNYLGEFSNTKNPSGAIREGALCATPEGFTINGNLFIKIYIHI